MSTTPSLLPPKNDRLTYGFFGYEGAMCDNAIRSDNAPMLKECVDLGFIKADGKMVGPRSVLEHCEKFAPKCAAMLKALA